MTNLSSRRHIVCRVGDADVYTATTLSGESEIILALDSSSALATERISDTVWTALDAHDLNPAPAAIDLYRAAAAVYAADARILRSESFDLWTRVLVLHLPVSDVAAWELARHDFLEFLSFLTGDRWDVVFRSVAAKRPSPKPRRPPISPPLTQSADAVCLLSGGLDSFVGALDFLARDKTLLLVSHNASGSARFSSPAQDEVMPALERVAGEPLVHLKMRVNPPKKIGDHEAESTQRSRSIIFLGLGVLAASAMPQGTPLIVPENGFISLNVPLTNGRLGSLSTRTTHPPRPRSVSDGLGTSRNRRPHHRAISVRDKRRDAEQLRRSEGPPRVRESYEFVCSAVRAQCRPREAAESLWILCSVYHSPRFDARCRFGRQREIPIRRPRGANNPSLVAGASSGPLGDGDGDSARRKANVDHRRATGRSAAMSARRGRRLLESLSGWPQRSESVPARQAGNADRQRNVTMRVRSPALIDTHCHLDLYSDPAKEIRETEGLGVLTIAVTNTPSVFSRLQEMVGNSVHIRVALGFHPELVPDRVRELPLFQQLLTRTRFVGEVGLDYVTSDPERRRVQRQTLGSIVNWCAAATDKVVTVHSRRAADDVVDIFGAFPGTYILHWYTGTKKALRRALENGAYISVNPAMLRSERSLSLLHEVPKDRVLTETDGPFVDIDGLQARPKDVERIVERLALLWSVESHAARATVYANFSRILTKKRAAEVSAVTKPEREDQSAR